jgi:hypothetical protein
MLKKIQFISKSFYTSFIGIELGIVLHYSKAKAWPQLIQVWVEIDNEEFA